MDEDAQYLRGLAAPGPRQVYLQPSEIEKLRRIADRLEYLVKYQEWAQHDCPMALYDEYKKGDTDATT
jgi:hypothetical protein